MSSPIYEIKCGRVFVGVAAGFAVAVIGVAIISGIVAAVVSAGFAALVAITVLWPACCVLKWRGQLKLGYVAVLGAPLIALPEVLFFLHDVVSPDGYIALRSDGVLLFQDGFPTKEGWLHFLIWSPLVLAPLGILGTLVGWFIAFGFRLEPRKISPVGSDTMDQDTSPRDR